MVSSQFKRKEIGNKKSSWFVTGYFYILILHIYRNFNKMTKKKQEKNFNLLDRQIESSAPESSVSETSAPSAPNFSLLDEQIKVESEGEKLARIEQNYVDFLSQYTFSMNTLDDTIYIDGRRFDDTEQSILKNFAYKEIKKLNVDRLLCKIQSHAFQKRFNPIEDFVKNLPIWDGIDRIKQIANCFVIKDNYIGFLFERKLEYFMAKAIKRWSKSEHGICLTLAGGQGIGKSTFFSWLCPLSDYFIAKEVNPDSKDDRLLRCQVMIQEIEELSSTTRKKDVDSLKAFLSCEVSEERKAYARLTTRKPCKAVFCATVNDNGGFLVDTENRRFLVVCVEKIDLAYEKIDKVQLWSQAKYAFENGKDQLTFEEKAIQQYENNLAKVESSIEIMILKYYEITGDENDFVPASELLTILTDEKISVRGNDMAAALIGLGAKRKQKGDKRIRGYSGLKRKKTEIENS
jgi:predicted P-loop ATPase